MAWEMLKTIFAPDSSLMDRVIASIFVGLVTLAITFIGWIVYIVIDSAWIKPSKAVITKITNRYVKPAYTTTSFIMVGKTLIPRTTRHPESYHLCVVIDGKEHDMSLTKEFVGGVSVGDMVRVDYAIGRISRSCIPTRIELVNGK